MLIGLNTVGVAGVISGRAARRALAASVDVATPKHSVHLIFVVLARVFR